MKSTTPGVNERQQSGVKTLCGDALYVSLAI